MRARPGAHRPPAGEERPPPPLALSAAGAPRWAAAGPGAGRRAGAPGGPWGCGSAAPRLPAAGAGAGGQVSGGAGGTGAALPPPPPRLCPGPGGGRGRAAGAPGSPQRKQPRRRRSEPLFPPSSACGKGREGPAPPPPVCPGVGGGWGIADSDGKGGGLPLEGGLREGQRRWDAKGKSAARKRGLRGGLGLCFLFALKWWKFGDALARCLHRLRCPSGLMRVVLVWQEGQVAFVGVPEEDCSAAVV